MKCLHKTLADILSEASDPLLFRVCGPVMGGSKCTYTSTQYTESGVWFRSLSLVILPQRVQFSSVVRKCFFQTPPRLRFEMDRTVSSISPDLHCILVPSTARTYLKQQSPLNPSQVWSGFFSSGCEYYHPIPIECKVTLCNIYPLALEVIIGNKVGGPFLGRYNKTNFAN